MNKLRSLLRLNLNCTLKRGRNGGDSNQGKDRSAMNKWRFILEECMMFCDDALYIPSSDRRRSTVFLSLSFESARSLNGGDETNLILL